MRWMEHIIPYVLGEVRKTCILVGKTEGTSLLRKHRNIWESNSNTGIYGNVIVTQEYMGT
jgi:hypothetical protein